MTNRKPTNTTDSEIGPDEKDAEIAHLKAEWHAEIERSKRYADGQNAVIDTMNDAHKILISENDAEIQKLNNIICLKEGIIRELSALCQEKDKLIKEMSDLLENLDKAFEKQIWAGIHAQNVDAVQRAREATR